MGAAAASPKTVSISFIASDDEMLPSPRVTRLTPGAYWFWTVGTRPPRPESRRSATHVPIVARLVRHKENFELGGSSEIAGASTPELRPKLGAPSLPRKAATELL